jgi:hypothetical protein
MAGVNGQLTICDRCGAQHFRKCIGEGEADGGYTRWNKFEDLPKGWGFVDVPRKGIRASGRLRSDEVSIKVCPDCHALWTKVVTEGFVVNAPNYVPEEVEA